MSLKTSYEFTLPRGYVDHHGNLQRQGRMRLATARDELAPLRDPTISGPDDPRLTILVLARVVEELGDLDLVSEHEIEGLFAADLAFLQDFYGVINFGTQEDYDALVAAQSQANLLGADERGGRAAAGSSGASAGSSGPSGSGDSGGSDADGAGPGGASRPVLRNAVEELPRQAQ